MKTFAPHRGFSVVELMVSVVIGMLAIMFATRLLASGEQEKAAALGSSDTMQNGMLAMFSLNFDASQAGWGLNDTLVNGCNTLMQDDSGYQLMTLKRGTVDTTPLTAVTITSGGERSDTISINSGGGLSGVSNVTLADLYSEGDQIRVTVNKPFGFNKGDVLLVAHEPAGGDCSLAQLSSVDKDVLKIAPDDGMRFNGHGGLLGGVYNQTNKARVFNLGPADKLALHTWSVERGVLRLRAANLDGAAARSTAVVSNVVAIKAQYGLDRRADFDPLASAQVTEWSNTMVDADGSLVTGDAGDYQRVTALRLAVIARSQVPEKPDPQTGKCTATTSSMTVFGTKSPANVNANPVTVRLDIAGDTVDWTCYRYRAFENIVQIRNNAWRP